MNQKLRPNFVEWLVVAGCGAVVVIEYLAGVL